MSGVYKIPAVQTDVIGVITNKFPTDAIRGAGRPEATHLIEVMIDQLAAELGMDPLELRRKNFIPPDDFPARDADRRRLRLRRLRTARSTSCSSTSTSTSSGAEQERAARARASTAASASRTYTEICGLAPSRVVGPERLRPAGRRLGVGAWCACTPPASVTVYTGTSPHGQGHETGVRADRRRPARASTPQQVDVIHGDTGTGPVRPRTPTARARWPSAARRSPGRPTKVADKAQGDRRPPARGRARGHRAARRQVHRSRARRTRA